VLKLQPGPLSIDEAVASVKRSDCGAVVIFIGMVRDHNEGKKVKRVSYSSFDEMARKEIDKIVSEAKSRWPIGEVHLAHRVGSLEVGDLSVVIAISSAHRVEAFEACRFVIDTLKKTVPIWKEEFYDSGKAWISTE
jgi:molybdopterin synthase catalytic subunit